MKTTLKALSMVGLCTLLSLTACNKNAASDTTESATDTTMTTTETPMDSTVTDSTKTDTSAADSIK